jgi:hypothetical protein
MVDLGLVMSNHHCVSDSSSIVQFQVGAERLLVVINQVSRSNLKVVLLLHKGLAYC